MVDRIFDRWSGHPSGLLPECSQDKEIEWIGIALPESPPDRAEYQASQVVVKEESKGVVTMAAGTVRIDRSAREVVVMLQTPSGPFWANGVYKLE